eukprot:TRINITY_DN2664_c0_g1_i1.p1 TRINITY_DN2664_c0_g1~~TRINITY_DN2664_c0_g1_i1.p1  ORF type:complete len:452 (-),score=52.11 TRINITY_DN2664_c0_g1_i1:101-1456(-)
MKYVPALFSNTVMMSLCSSGVAHAQGYLQENKSTGSPYAGEAMFLDQFFDKFLETTGGDLITLSAEDPLLSQANLASETNCTWSDPWLFGPVTGCHLDTSSSFVSQALTQLSAGVREFFEVVVHDFDRCRSKGRAGCEQPGSRCEWTQFLGEACVPSIDWHHRGLIHQALKAAYGDICSERHVTAGKEWAAPEEALNKMCNKTKAACQQDPVCSWLGEWWSSSPCDSPTCQWNDWYEVLQDRDATRIACSATPEYEQYERHCNMSSVSASVQAACLHSACSALFHHRLENEPSSRGGCYVSRSKERCEADRRCGWEQFGGYGCADTPEAFTDASYARECPLWSVEVNQMKCTLAGTENACLANGCSWFHEVLIKCEDGVRVPCDSGCKDSGQCRPSAAQISRAFTLTARDKTVIRQLSSLTRACRSQTEHTCTKLQPAQTSTILDESLVFP